MKNIQKKITFLFCFIVGLSISVKAQTGEKTSRELYQDYLETINRNHLNTDYILNRGFINDDEVSSLHQFIESYDEEKNQIVAPISQMDGVSWVQIYNNLLESEISTTKRLPSIEKVTTQLKNNTSSAIPIVIFDVKGELLEDVEIENSINNLPKENMYNEVHVFGAISHTNISYSKNVIFELKLENYFSGFDKKESEIFIDFSDGRGIKKFSTSQGTIFVNYTSLGEKLIKVYRNTNLNGNSMKIGSSFIIDVKNDNSENSSLLLKSNVKSKISQNKDVITNNGAKAHICLGKDNVFDKPIIIVQGFDPIGQITIDSQQDKYSDFDKGLRDKGYDIVYLMLKNTNLPLEDNTSLVKDLIKQINSQKQRNFESIVIGESMGGLLARMALKELENENYDHKVGLYISFDAPHQGANLPPGLLHLFNDIVGSRVFKAISNIVNRRTIDMANLLISPFTGNRRTIGLSGALQVNMALRALEALNSPAAKSMLVRHIKPDGFFNASQATLKSLGYPANSRNIALVNGSNESRDLQRKEDGSIFIPGEILIQSSLWKSDCNEFSFNAWSSPTNINARVSQIKLKVGVKRPDIRIRWENRCILKVVGKCVLRTKVPVKVTVGSKCVSANIVNKKQDYNFNGASYDDAPGSTFPGVDQFPVDITINPTFVPTASAIDLSDTAYNSSQDPSGLRAVTNSTVLDNFILNDQTPFDEVYSRDRNTAHVQLFGSDTEFNEIIEDEFMLEDLDIQNKIITNNRDFEADSNINVGNNINTRTGKIYASGGVVIENNSNVTFTAKNKINLYPGTSFKNGSVISLKVQNTFNKTRIKDKIEVLDGFKIKIIGDREYNVGKLPSFKVLSSNLNLEYDYSWELLENNEITSNNDEFVIDELLYPGRYTVKVKVTSKKTSRTKIHTIIFKVVNKLETTNNQKESNILVNVPNVIQVYPNPVINDVTVMAKKEISKIRVYDLSSKFVLEIKNINKTWQSLNLANLSKGVYIFDIHFKDKTTSVQKKIIKK